MNIPKFTELYRKDLELKNYAFNTIDNYSSQVSCSQWILFLSFLLLNILIVGPISKLVRFSFAYTLLHWINSLIGFAFGLFVVINHFHLKIDTYKLFIQLFS